MPVKDQTHGKNGRDDFNGDIEVPFYRELFKEIKELGGREDGKEDQM